nr:T-cell receptor alpha variable region [Danio rerio]
MLLCVLIMLSSLAGEVIGEVITSRGSEKEAQDGTKVTLSCNYTGVVYNLLWYRQYQRFKPELLLSIAESGEAVKADPSAHWLSATVHKQSKLTELEISPAKVTDSAVYYCALTTGGGGYKIIFGTGTKLIVETKTEVKPNIYQVGNSCLATDFTKHNVFNISGSPFLETSAVRYSGQSYYSSFKFGSDYCEETGVCLLSGGGTDLEKDEKVNFLSLGIFWLRILFLKTVVFNVLVTFKAWMS